MTHDYSHTTDLNLANLNLLVSLAVLLDEAHVSRAADRLGMTQSAISHVLNRARELFDDPLLIKGKQGMVRTVRAEQLRLELVEFVHASSVIFQSEQFDPSQVKGQLRFSCNDFIAEQCISEMLNQLASQAPFLEISYCRHHKNSLQDLQQGQLDLLIGTHRHIPSTLRYQDLGPEHYHLILGKRYLEQGITSLTQAWHYPLADYSADATLNQSVAQLAESQAQKPQIGLSSGSLIVLQTALSSGLLNAIVPHYVCERFTAEDPLQHHVITDLASQPIKMLWPEHLDQQDLHTWSRQIILQVCQQQLWPN
ncbi:LysR family transcriptional regulator [Motilimonas pumila]|uniref:LysR family transcriptional regulator n=1 Tax=Motilimonas pumila TaxID=2303987 RepID=A0A418YCS8_9GAMM|nr:LysR family transcriptional regulator [Motilimonas pumila]RJG42329.1 LysR family transcriptional regulator [Motilimonas pumila]